MLRPIAVFVVAALSGCASQPHASVPRPHNEIESRYSGTIPKAT